MDLFMGYHQLSIIESDRPKTAFAHNGQVYQYIRAPMGLRHTGNVFCRALHETSDVSGIDRRHIYSYVDDLFCACYTFEQFIEICNTLFKALIKTGLRLKPSKCSFLADHVPFLGRTLSPDGISPDPSMVSGVAQNKTPSPRAEWTLKLHQGLHWHKNEPEDCWLKFRRCNEAHL